MSDRFDPNIPADPTDPTVPNIEGAFTGLVAITEQPTIGRSRLDRPMVGCSVIATRPVKAPSMLGTVGSVGSAGMLGSKRSDMECSFHNAGRVGRPSLFVSAEGKSERPIHSGADFLRGRAY